MCKFVRNQLYPSITTFLPYKNNYKVKNKVCKIFVMIFNASLQQSYKITKI